MKYFLVFLILIGLVIQLFGTSQAFAEPVSREEYSLGKVEWLYKCHPLVFNMGTIRVIDSDMNLDDSMPDKFDIEIFSDYNENNIQQYVNPIYTVIENGNSTGVFEGMLFWGDPHDEGIGHRVPIWHNTTVTAKYVDFTLPSSYLDSELEITSSIVVKDVKPIETKNSDGILGLYYAYDPCTIELWDMKKDPKYDVAYDFIFPSPLKQIKSGLTTDEIQCKENLVLIQKHNDFPACVTEQTKQKLIERGWTANSENKITIKDYKIDCNDQMNPHKEYECFKNAYSNCDVATVSPEIYTIEGDPIYTTLTITPDCKIQGTADMSTDRFWRTPEIITTQCEKIVNDQYMWTVKNCDAKNLPEMQFNFEMQLYPKILECEESGNTWSRETLSCINKYDTSSESIWKKYITVSASRNDDPTLADALPVYDMVNKTNDEILHDLLFGADGCKEETVCKISSGISLDRTYSFLPSNIMISDNDQYTTTIDVAQAEQLRAILDWKQSDGSFYSVVHFDGKQYFLTLSTFDSEKTPDVKMDVLGTFAKPVALEKGHALNYTIAITAWSTYGADAQIDLMAVQDAKDSGIDVWIEPSIITVPERSNATTTLFIKAQDNANDGIYDIRVIGHANGKLADLYCSNTICPTVNIGDSDWSIRTFGSGTNMGIGGIESPKNTFLELDLNKKEFLEGDTVEIKTYLINNSTETIMFVPDRLLIKVIKAQDMGYYDNLYGIDARYESDEPLVLVPHSKTLLVRPFYWNQNTFENFDDEKRVDARQHKMIAKFVGENYAWNDDVWFEIK